MSINLSLHRIEALIAQFEAYTRPTVHIAGTNGKGSVSALLTSIFRHAELSVGRFNSPHLLHPSDSISLNGTPVNRDAFSETIQEVRRKSEEHAINASSFEVLTVCALLVFERAKVDVVLLEVGMGGRLDATNIIPDECVLVSVITPIDLDHQAFLGSTVEAIAREKAGIIRKGRPVVLASQNHKIVSSAVEEVANEMSAPLVVASVSIEREWDKGIDGEPPSSFSLRPFAPPPPRPVEVIIPTLSPQDNLRGNTATGDTSVKYRAPLPLHGSHQLVNLGVALTVLDVLRSRASSTSDVYSSPPSHSSPSTSMPLNHRTVCHRLAQIGERTIHEAVRDCTWPGRLSFHLYREPASIDEKPLSADNRIQHEPLVVLVDGAHNEPAARSLSAYVSSLLSSLGSSDGGGRKKRRIRLTVVVALSHSPPKTPTSVLIPLLAPFIKPFQDSYPHSTNSNAEHSPFGNTIELTTRVALLRFSPPEDMPWVRPVLSSAMRQVVSDSFPGISEDDLWAGSDADADTGIDGEKDVLRDLKNALHWASRLRGEGAAGQDEEREENLVLVAGSLYLVADFYRLLQMQEELR